ncbi:MAG: hypothetical protein WC764_03395 [Candidatus Paceibacterota bacterium]|jgi:hypothetical protein
MSEENMPEPELEIVPEPEKTQVPAPVIFPDIVPKTDEPEKPTIH